MTGTSSVGMFLNAATYNEQAPCACYVFRSGWQIIDLLPSELVSGLSNHERMNDLQHAF